MILAGPITALCVPLVAGDVVRLPVTRDTWVSTAPGERDGNNGGESKLKTKGYQEFSLVDLDPSALRGRVVTSAKLHVRVASKDPLRRITVSTIATDWVEGDGTGYDVQPGSASFLWAAPGMQDWSYSGGDITSVILGQGNTLWRWADATSPDADGWQTITVDPDVVAARVAGISFGFIVFDDVGSEYTRDGETFEYRRFLNRFFFSRESGEKNAPYFTVELGSDDREAPDAVSLFERDPSFYAPGAEQRITWTTPVDHGAAGVIGFELRWSAGGELDWERARPFPRSPTPLAAPGAGIIGIPLPNVPFLPGEPMTIGVRAIDRAGNASAVTTLTSSGPPLDVPVQLGSAPFRAFRVQEGSASPRVVGLEVAIVDALDKVDPRTGAMIPARPLAYRLANHLWSSADRRIRLSGARNECVDFQVVLSGAARDIRASIELEEGLGAARIHRFAYVEAKRGALPDPLVPLTPSFAIPDATRPVDGERHAALLVEIEVASDARAASHRGKLVIEADGEKIEIAIGLRVWDFALPDRLSFLAEMNAYSLPDAPGDIAYYRLAHEHRTVLNRLGYDWRGRISRGCGPAWNGEAFDWKEYDAHFGPLLDGSAFAGLPRGPIPVEAFYLPLNESWPIPIESGFRGGYWADEALEPAYLASFSKACAQFAAHANAKGWHDTLFEFYLNNKIYFKDKEWSRSSAPWIFDEPENTQDFFALRVFGSAFHAGVASAHGPAKLVFRCDLSRPEWRRDLLDGIADVAVIGHALRAYPRWVHEKQQRFGEIVQNYSTANAIEESNVQPVAWCLDAWSLGADGVIPWQTIGTEESWRKADALALLYPGGPAGLAGPLPSARLKAFRRGEQDVEYLTLLALTFRRDRRQIAASVRRQLALVPRSMQKNSDDAGTLAYPGVLPEDLWRLRVAVGSALDHAKPAPRDRLVDLRPPPRGVSTPLDPFRARQRVAPADRR